MDAILEEEPDAIGSNSDSLKRYSTRVANSEAAVASASVQSCNVSADLQCADAGAVRSRDRNAHSAAAAAAAMRPASAISVRQLQRLHRPSPSSKSHSSSEASDAADEAEPARRSLGLEAAALPFWSGNGSGAEFERLHKGQKRRPLARIAPIRRDSDLNDAMTNANEKLSQPDAANGPPPPPLDEEAAEADANEAKEAAMTRSVSSVSSSEHAARTGSPGAGAGGSGGVLSGGMRSRPVSRVQSASAGGAGAAVRLKLWLRERTHSEALNGLLSKHSARSHSACTRLSDMLCSSAAGVGGAAGVGPAAASASAGNGTVSTAALAKARQNSLPIGYRPTRSNVVTRTQTTELEFEPDALARLEETLAQTHHSRSSSRSKRHASAPPAMSPLVHELAAAAAAAAAHQQQAASITPLSTDLPSDTQSQSQTQAYSAAAAVATGPGAVSVGKPAVSSHKRTSFDGVLTVQCCIRTATHFGTRSILITKI